MRFYVISDNVDTQVGMRLAGIEGIVVHEADEVHKALSDAMEQDDIAVILMTEPSCPAVPGILWTISSSTVRGR